MAYINRKNSIPLTFNDFEFINKMAFDGCSYYFTLTNTNRILKTDKNMSIECCYDTCRNYEHICYDFCENCFWATSTSSFNCLYKLDCCMKEISCLQICNCYNVGDTITGISYNCSNDSIILSFTYGLIEVDKEYGECRVIFCEDDVCITGVICVSPGLIISAIRNEIPYIFIFNDKMKITYCYKLPCDYMLQDMIFNPCNCECDCNVAIDLLLVNRSCSAHIYKHVIDECTLGYVPDKCNYIICDKCCFDNPDIDCSTSYIHVIESIALIETALSHILNAEGEKLQKVIACSNNLNEILCVNKDVRETIISITHLENVLYDKLRLAVENSDICDNDICCKKNNICNCDCDY